MLDLNDLKTINDVYGHDHGDQYLIGSCRQVCEVFKHSPVYRIGGDEFLVVLEAAFGMAVYNSEDTDGPEAVIKLADTNMYQNKKAVKEA